MSYAERPDDFERAGRTCAACPTTSCTPTSGSWSRDRRAADRGGAHPHQPVHRALGAAAHGLLERGGQGAGRGDAGARAARPGRRSAGAGAGEEPGHRRARGRRRAAGRSRLGGPAAMKLAPDQKLDLREVLQDLDQYRPRRTGWTWRAARDGHPLGPFVYEDTSAELAALGAAAGGPPLRRHRSPVRHGDHHRDRLRALRGRPAAHAHGRLARRRPPHGDPHHRPVAYRRPDRGHAGGGRRHPRSPASRSAPPARPWMPSRTRSGGRSTSTPT